MSAMIKPLIGTFKATAAIAKGKAVKFGADNATVSVAAAATDAVIGIAQNAAVNAGDLVEVALPGGGAKGLAHSTIALGDRLGCYSDGTLIKVATQGDAEFAIAMDAAAAGDVFSVMVKGNTSAYATQS